MFGSICGITLKNNKGDLVIERNGVFVDKVRKRVTGKQHKNLMRDIRNMKAAWEKTCGLKFEQTSRTINQPNGGTR